ncbi:MAG: PPC domain-containing protein [Acidobacteriota bacterium]
MPSPRSLRLPVLGLLAALFVGHALASSDTRRALRVVSDGPADLAAVAKRLESHGARIRHLVAPDLLLGDISDAALSAVRDSGVTLDLVASPTSASPSPASPGAVSSADRLGQLYFQGLPTTGGDRPEPPPLRGDALLPDPRDGLRPHSGGSCRRSGRVLIGRVAIGIVMLESDGTLDADTEDWTNDDPAYPGMPRPDLVTAEIIEGMDALVSQFPEAGLSFAYDPNVVSIPYEAINRGAGERWQWGGAAMDTLGFSGFGGVNAYVEELKERFDADSGTVAFILDSLNDDDGYPSSGNFAYAILNGNYLVMTYDNNGWRIDGMDVVMAHEVGHNYGALDEYRSAGNSCSHLSGFLRVKNGNNDSAAGDSACESAVNCFMRANRTLNACSFTAHQLGIRDTDGDGILDPLDAPPDSTLDGAAFQVFETDAPSFTGTVSSFPDESEIEHARPAAFNDVTAAEYRVDGGAWMALAASDGDFGDTCETVDIALSGLSEGLHLLELRGTNDLGLVEPSPAAVEVYVNTDCADDPAEPDDSLSQAWARSGGLHAGLMRCAYDQDWSRFHLAGGAEVRVTVDHDAAASPLTVALVGPTGAELDSAMTTGGTVTLTVTAPFAGTHHVSVDGIADAETGYDLTIDADCIDDPSEPNATLATGAAVALGTTPDLVVCPDDVDHYLVGVQAFETLTVELAFEHDLGDLDLIVHAPDGTEAGRSDGTSDTERVEAMFTQEGLYGIEVRGKTTADSNVHDLTVTLTGCFDDLRENDDTQADARPLVPGEVLFGRLCDTDSDWFSFNVPETSLLRVQLNHSVAESDLDLELYRATPAGVYRRSTLRTSPEDITIKRAAAGDYFVRVYSTLGGAASYSLNVEVEDPILLFVTKTDTDAVLEWNDAGQECYTVSRSELPSDFTGAVESLVNDPAGDEDGEPLTVHVDPGVIVDDTRLYCYLVRPHDCGYGRIEATKTASPSPCVPPEPGGIPSVTYTISATNTSDLPVWGVSLEDSIPTEFDSFSVLSIPPGATDETVGRDVRVTNIDIPVGQTASVIVEGTLPPRVSEWPLIPSNQGLFRVPNELDPDGTVHLTDDPTTLAYQDDTRTAYWGFYGWFAISAYWHADMDLDLVILDPCGNLVSVADSRISDCDMNTGSINEEHSCALTVGSGRHESVIWFSGVPFGTYEVFLRFAETADDDGECTDRGAEDVTLMLAGQFFGGLQCHTFTLEPSSDLIYLHGFEIP